MVLPTDAREPALATHGAQSMALSVPGAEDARQLDAASVHLGSDDADFVVQSTEAGLRALVHIDSTRAPERFPFDLGGDASDLRIQEDGSVLVLDTAGEAIAQVEVPWAVDAEGVHVPTHFEVEGATLVQVVEHRGGTYAYGVVVDPSVVWWTKNIGICAAQIALILVPGKLATVTAKFVTLAKKSAKIRKALDIINQVGGVADPLRLMKVYVTSRGKDVSAANKKRLKQIFEYGASMLVEELGIGTCYTVAKEIW